MCRIGSLPSEDITKTGSGQRFKAISPTCEILAGKYFLPECIDLINIQNTGSYLSPDFLENRYPTPRTVWK